MSESSCANLGMRSFGGYQDITWSSSTTEFEGQTLLLSGVFFCSNLWQSLSATCTKPQLGVPFMTPALGHSWCVKASGTQQTSYPEPLSCWLTAEVVVAGDSEHGVCVRGDSCVLGCEVSRIGWECGDSLVGKRLISSHT